MNNAVIIQDKVNGMKKSQIVVFALAVLFFLECPVGAAQLALPSQLDGEHNRGYLLIEEGSRR